jgi:hypothetical protein
MVLDGHGPGVVGADPGSVLPQAKAPLHGPVDPLLLHHLELPGLVEHGHVAVHAGLGDVGKRRAQLGGGAGPPAGHGVHDAQTHRVQHQLEDVHRLIFPYLVPFPKLGKQT